MSPPQRAVFTTGRCLSGWSEGSVATGGRQGSCGLLGSAFHQVAHTFLVTPEALVPQHEAHAALQLGVFFAAVAAVLAEIAGSVGLAEFHRPQTLPAGALCSVELQ